MSKQIKADTPIPEKKEQVECERCKQKESIIGEYKAKYLRALADYQNLEKRVQEQRLELIRSANKQLLLRLLGFLDDLDRAHIFIQDKNLDHIRNSYLKILQEEGLTELDVVNKVYDPFTAEVIDIVKGEKDNIVIEVLRKGYAYHGTVIRVAQVKVSKTRK